MLVKNSDIQMQVIGILYRIRLENFFNPTYEFWSFFYNKVKRAKLYHSITFGMLILHSIDDACFVTKIQLQKVIVKISDQILKIGHTQYHSSTIDNLCWMILAGFRPYSEIIESFRKLGNFYDHFT